MCPSESDENQEILVPVSDASPLVPWAFSFSACRSAVGASVHNQFKTILMNMEIPPVKAVPESVKCRPTSQRLPVKAVPNHVQGKAPPPPQEVQPNQRERWPATLEMPRIDAFQSVVESSKDSLGVPDAAFRSKVKSYDER